MKSHIYRIIKNKLTIIIFTIIILIPCVDISLLLVTNTNYHPAFAFFLSGTSVGHASQMILLWFLPIYFLLLCSDDSIQDYKTGYYHILISKVGRKKYCLEKIFTSFVVSFLTMFSSLLINFLLVQIFFFKGTFKNDLDQIKFPDNSLYTFSMAHPYVAIMLFSIICCIMSGFVGALGSSLSLFFRNKKYAYPASFFIWFLLILKKNSLMLLFQPFTEYGFNVLFPILCLSIFIFLVIISSIILYEAKYNES
ncbi:DUF2705 family protein [Bacillus subtilis]|uniref:DUF2705 family protein n=1 Tax=Bacillus subtilis TaxID=1423 RepID=UPI000DF02CDC|nr:DUF2705 family protein [Bacillus subtilis]AXC55055.1 hypothetical protein DQ231_20305 [Bacillus spizizenii]NRF03219.1 hypothetical protein [Bacillus subtilis]NRG38543.1 hypothetical protein [Bacillus subtilis]